MKHTPGLGLGGGAELTGGGKTETLGECTAQGKYRVLGDALQALRIKWASRRLPGGSRCLGRTWNSKGEPGRDREGCSRPREQHGQSTEACHSATNIGGTLKQFQLTEQKWKGGNETGRSGVSRAALKSSLPSRHPLAQPLPHQVLAAGIEANIPVTYGIGSQRGHESTGCQFIGQSPVHSIMAAD